MFKQGYGYLNVFGARSASHMKLK